MKLKTIATFLFTVIFAFIMLTILNKYLNKPIIKTGIQIFAILEAIDLKPHLPLKKGDCRIQNTLFAINSSKKEYIVLGKFYNPFNNTTEKHQWITLNPEEPAKLNFIIDKTTGMTDFFMRAGKYIPSAVLTLDSKSCTAKIIKVYDNPSINNVEFGKAYIETFCIFYKLFHR